VTQEAYVDRSTFHPATTAVKPETSSGYDIGSDVAFGRAGRVSLDFYDTNIFNRFTTFTSPVGGVFDGKTYKNASFNGNVSNSRDEGIELSVDERPLVGLGFHGSIDLDRTYAYNVSDNLTGNAAGPYSYLANGAQLAGYPFSKERAELSYTTGAQQVIRFGASSFGQWNSYGEPGFTVFDGSISAPLKYGIRAQVSAQNIFNHDDGRVFTEYQYGYAPAQATGGLYPVNLYFYQPRTITFQLSRSFGP
jgi:hypothetical protein